MKKYVLFFAAAIILLSLSCNDKYDFSNPLDSQSTLQAPTNLKLISITETAVILQFKDPNVTADYPNAKLDYEIEQSTDASNYTKVNNVSFSGAQVTVTGTFYSTLTYSFRMRAKVANSLSVYSNITTANLLFPAPTNLAVNIATETKATLAWTNTNTLATTVIIEKSNNGTNYTVIDSTVATAITKDVVGIYSSDTTYYFRIKYKSNLNQSVYTAPVAQKLGFPAPSNLAVNISSETKATVTWTNTNSFATMVIIEKSIDGSIYKLVDSVAATSTSKDIAGVYSSDTIYYFRIKYKSNLNQSAYTTSVSQKLSFPAPSKLHITSMTTIQVDLSWQDNSSFETSFEIEQSTDGNNFYLVKTVGANVTSTTITGTYDSTKTYYFRVQARTAINKSGYSNVASKNMADMVLVQGGTVIPCGTGSYNFGNIVTGTSSDKITFTIQNLGNQTLKLTGNPLISVSDSNADQFNIDQSSLSSTIAAGSNSTFVITFSPASYGAKTATISIPNNDYNKDPYTFTITGIGSTRTVWDVTADFSIDNGNPNSAWSYGWMDTGFKTFTLYTYRDYSTNGGNPAWHGAVVTPWTNGNMGAVWKNMDGPIYGAINGQLSLHPGYGPNVPAVVRWTAPAGVSGHATIAGQFFAGDAGIMLVYVWINGVEVWSAVDSGVFNLATNVASGDTIDFAVGVRPGYDHTSGTTPLDAKITMIK